MSYVHPERVLNLVTQEPTPALDTARDTSPSTPLRAHDLLVEARSSADDLVEDAMRQREPALSATQSAIEAIGALCLDDVMSGEWEEALRLAEAGLLLCQVHDYPELRWPLWLTQGMVSAFRGDVEESVRSSDDIDRWASSRGSRRVQLHARYVRSLASLARGDHERAYRHLSPLILPSTFVAHLPLAVWACLEIVESAVRTDRRTEAAEYVAMLETVESMTLSPRVRLMTGCAAALVSSPVSSAVDDVFERSLATPGLERWPFDVARVELLYGEHLRRARSITRARKHLKVAADTFDRLGARPWASRAATEWRATGATTPDVAPSTMQPLTHQELEIARLAASGLTNKEIAARIYLSHRTVGAHLYRVFPKLGISSRAALRDALTAIPTT
jgi:ATP/maltotriose-dependent transcriptional regulator MalT